MPTDTRATEQKLATLIDLLSCGDQDEHEIARIVDICQQAQEKPAETLVENYGKGADQVAQYDPQGVTAFVIFVELEDYFAVSDTVDELHEQVVEAFETPQLPDFPYDNNMFKTVSDYFQWLDAQLLIHHPAYRLMHFGQSYTHDFQTILIRRDTAESLLALCLDLKLEAEYCE
jgi:hypothetical protein